jgi:sterol desaturase/sphingolipid hydroxylase (fatty acid hydroxylase superfamily)
MAPIVLLILLLRVPVYMVIERRYRAYEIRYRDVIWRDITAAILLVPILVGADLIDSRVLIKPAIPASVMDLPLTCRIVLYVLLADFGHYWVHRLMHTPFLWRIHKWHHNPTYMYWLAVRTSLPQQILVNAPYVLASFLLGSSLVWLGGIIFIKNVLQNDWTHLNVRWGNRWVEWIIVTPRYHHVHHSDKPEYYGANQASLLPIWDHLFGTFIDPETLPENPRFGVGEKLPVIRLALGV